MISQDLPQATQVLAGSEMGGIPLVTALSLETGIPCAFVRKGAYEHGTGKLIEGEEIVGKQVFVVEDVVTSGGQIIETVDKLRSAGAIVENAVCVILRDKSAVERLKDYGIKLISLFTREELESS